MTMDSETNPVMVLFTESQRLEALMRFWYERINIERIYLDNLSRLRIPDASGNGQLQELAHKTRELLIDERDERRRGLERLEAARKALSNEFWEKDFGHRGRTMEISLRKIDSLAAKAATAEATTERLAVKARESFFMSSSTKKESQARSNVFSRLLPTRTKQPDDTSRFLSADSAYRQKVQKLNDEKYTIQNEIVPQATRHIEHDKKCIAALRHLVSTFSAVQSDLAQVLNVTSSQLCNVSSSVDASVESASFAERLDESFTSLIRPRRYTSYEISSSLRPTTILFGCPFPDELDGASMGQRAVVEAFRMILSSAANGHPRSLYRAICAAHGQQSDDTKLSALQLEVLWDSSQRNGGPGAVEYLAKAPSDSLLLYFLTRLPTPLLELNESEIKRIAKLPSGRENDDRRHDPNVTHIFTNAGNRMSRVRRCNLARLLLTLQRHEEHFWTNIWTNPTVIRTLTRTPYFLPQSRSTSHFVTATKNPHFFTNKSIEDSLILPEDFIEELKHAGLLT